MTSRRELLHVVAVTALGLACGLPDEVSELGSARLTARPGNPTSSITAGLWPFGAPDVDGYYGYLRVPATYDPADPMPLVLALHGGGSSAKEWINSLSPYAEEHGFLLLAVESRGETWDAINGPYGPDVAVIDASLQFAFERCAVDAARLVVLGFSDGASYALGLGRANGDLFSRIAAFSPGFIPTSADPDRGRPEIFISHGRQDPVLPIATTRLIVQAMQESGYAVTYEEFDGGHSIPLEIGLQALLWLLR